ncbi:MAG: signal peptidase I [Oscillospiraceae bacterium]|nr:signal peptidase I [Oscillospiraceae bacterium]MBQ2862329.1 signal peptidase I [Oscillospiraceae bacterium]MBQ3236336.1 signal peptidase I [Oscillospiraceae bacterium]MBQ6699900.1 signal peptidase I [Oscillospiraceae bacterium]
MNFSNLPNSAEVEKELKREKYKLRYKKTLKSTVFALITASAAAVLIATLWLPVLQIFGSSMTPTLQEGEVVLSVKTDNLEPGDIVAFYYGNKVLIKRYIAGPGSWVNILEDGTVFVDDALLVEPYVSERSLGICDLEFPYQVPEDTYFLVGDHRSTSVDSRHSSVGCISEDQIVGKIVYRVWPFEVFGTIE